MLASRNGAVCSFLMITKRYDLPYVKPCFKLTLLQIVGKIKDDFVVWGFTNLLQEAFRLIQTLQLDVATR
jgi:hypothetical protein